MTRLQYIGLYFSICTRPGTEANFNLFHVSSKLFNFVFEFNQYLKQNL